MNTNINIASTTRYILKKYPEARDNDQLLQHLVTKFYGINLDTIVRSRQKAQRLNKDLRGKRYNERKIKGELVSEMISNQ